MRTLAWSHGAATLNALGAMLAPVVFRAAGHRDFAPLHIAPWADDTDLDRWPPALAQLRGDWPCVPFGRCDRPAELPSSWTCKTPHDDWAHGHAAHHRWQWLESDDPHTLQLQIELLADPDLQRLTRTVRAVPGSPALELELRIDARRPCVVPVALHPTLRLTAGRVQLAIDHEGSGLSYPAPPEPGRSRVAANARFDSLASVPLDTGEAGDFTRYPQPANSEELLQLMDVSGAIHADFLDAGWRFTLDWDRTLLPDLMLWVSHGGRLQPPWNGRHFALGLEPVNAAMDLGRVASPPPGHPLASRQGLALTPDAPCVIRSRFCAAPLSADA